MTTEHLPVKGVAEVLAISVDQVKKLITSGELPAMNVGVGSRVFWRVSRDDLDHWIEAQRAATARRFGTAS